MPKKPVVAAVLPRVVLIDANVFFGPRLRDVVMHLHEAGIIRAHWTKEIESEWTRNVVAKHGGDPTSIQNCLMGMRAAAPDWQVSGYKKHIAKFEAVDAKDRHVAAAAYKLSLDDWPGQRVALVTRNIPDFPAHAFDSTNVIRYGLGPYLHALYQEEPEHVARVIEGCIRKLKVPPVTLEQYVGVLVLNGCSPLAEALASRWKVECPKVGKDHKLFYESDRP